MSKVMNSNSLDFAFIKSKGTVLFDSSKSKGTVLFDSNSINYQSKNIIKADESGQ